MSLATPEKIRTLQRKLYLKAKAEPDFRFHQLADKVWREDILARANAGAPGVDGVTFAGIEAAGLEEWLARLREALRQKTYRCQPVRQLHQTDPECVEIAQGRYAIKSMRRISPFRMEVVWANAQNRAISAASVSLGYVFTNRQARMK